jgi:hypothetical protein
MPSITRQDSDPHHYSWAPLEGASRSGTPACKWDRHLVDRVGPSFLDPVQADRSRWPTHYLPGCIGLGSLGCVHYQCDSSDTSCGRVPNVHWPMFLWKVDVECHLYHGIEVNPVFAGRPVEVLHLFRIFLINEEFSRVRTEPGHAPTPLINPYGPPIGLNINERCRSA